MKPLIVSFLRWLHIAWANVLRNRRRSTVTAAIAAIGSAAVLIAGGFTLYTYRALAESSARMTGHLVLATPAQFSRDEEVPLQHGLTNAERIRSQLLAEPAVRQVLPRVEFSGLIGNGEKSTVMMAVGIEADSEFAIKGPFLKLQSGRVLSGDERAHVLLGDGLARSLKAAPGTTLTLLATTVDGALNALDVTVAGTFSTGVTEIDKRLVYIDVFSAQQLLATDRITSLGVFLDRMESTEPLRARIQNAQPELAVQTWVEQAAFYRSVRDLYNRIFGGLGLVIGIIVVFVVTNAMAMAVIERTREVGTLRALGTLPQQLVGCFALEGLLLGGLGAILGAAITGLITVTLLWLPIQMPPPPGRSSGYPLQIAFDGTLYGVTLLSVLALSAIASAAVARRAVHRPIVDALMHT